MNDQIEDCDEDDHFLGAQPGPLATRRLILRCPEERDAQELAELANDMEIARQTRRMPHPYTLKDAESWIASAGKAAPGRKAAFVITRRNGGTVLGATGYDRMEERGDVELGYWIGKPYWGNGYATEAAQAVIDDAFAVGAIERIHGRCRVANSASRRVLEKCGFQYSGSGMCDCNALKSLVPSEDFMLERSVWVSLKRWGAG